MKLTVLLFVILALAGCAKPTAKIESDIVATAGGRAIRLEDLRAEIARRKAVGDPKVSPEQVLEDLITREAFIVRALELDLDREAALRHRYENLLIGELKRRELQPR